jgi:ribosomal protein L7/L12
MQKVKLDCDACGAPLENINHLELYKCPYCGRSYMFKDEFQADSKPARKHPAQAKTNHIIEVQPYQRQFSNRTELIAKIRAMSAAGQKIQAIKLYRDELGTSLTEAKDFVENLMGK